MTRDGWGSRDGGLGGVVLLGLVLPALPALQTHQSTEAARTALFLGCLGILGLGLVGYVRGIPYGFRRGSIVPLLVASTGALYGAVILWNFLFLRANSTGVHEGDVFRLAYRTFRSPIYGVAEIPSATDFLWIGLPLLGFGAAFVWATLRRDFSIRRWALLICAFQLVMIGSFALTQSSERLTGLERDYESFALPEDLERFDTLPDVFAEWNDYMSVLHLRNRHYPPGNLFMMKLEQTLEWDGFFRWVVILATLATTLLMVPLARSLELSLRGQRLAMLLLATSTGPLVFPTSFTAPLTMFFSAGACVCLLAALRAGSGGRYATTAGVLLAVCALFSFVVMTIGLLLAALMIVGIITKRHSLVRSIRVGGQTVGVMIVVLFLVWLVLGFNIVECLSIARSNAQELMGASSFDDPTRYLLRSTGNVLAYITYTGAILTSLAVASLRKITPAPLRMAAFATFAALLFSGFSGQFWLETERIWIFFTPMLAVLAAGTLSDRCDPEDRATESAVLGNNVLTASGQELWHLHYV